MTRRFDAVLLDAGGVLVVPDPTVLGPLLAPYGASVEEAAHVRAHYAGMRAQDAGPAPAPGEREDWTTYDRAYVAALGVPADEQAEAAMLLGRTRTPWLWRYPLAASVEAVGALVRRGVPVGIVSNASGQIEATLRRSGVCQVGVGDGHEVVCVVDSHVVGVAKPDPAIFVSALEALGEPARERVAYVGDSVRNDVGAAGAAGLAPLLLDPFADHAGGPHERIASLNDVLAWV
jgi:putative hydrolase of the HAD superfamily